MVVVVFVVGGVDGVDVSFGVLVLVMVFFLPSNRCRRVAAPAPVLDPVHVGGVWHAVCASCFFLCFMVPGSGLFFGGGGDAAGEAAGGHGGPSSRGSIGTPAVSGDVLPL